MSYLDPLGFDGRFLLRIHNHMLELLENCESMLTLIWKEEILMDFPQNQMSNSRIEFLISQLELGRGFDVRIL